MTAEFEPDPEIYDKWTDFRRRHANDLLDEHHELDPTAVIIRYLSAMDSAHTDMYEDVDAKLHFKQYGKHYTPEATELIEWLSRNGWTIVRDR